MTERTIFIVNDDEAQGELLRTFTSHLSATVRISERLEERTKEVQRLLEEEYLLKRKIHYRVKNNLAATSALVGPRGARVEDSIARGVLVQTRNDVEPVARIYESHFQSENGQSEGNQLVNAVHHFRSLIVQAIARYPRIGIKINEDLEWFIIDPTTAVRLGIILKELITNALEYAFSDCRTRTIAVSFHQDGNTRNSGGRE